MSQVTLHRQPRQTVKMMLDEAIEKHGFAEILERLADLAFDRAQASQHPEAAEHWQLVTKHLEVATNQALDLPE